MSSQAPYDPVGNDELTKILTRMALGGRDPEQVEEGVVHPDDPNRDLRTQISPMQQPRDILGEAMSAGNPPIPWSAGYTGAMGASPETQQLVDQLLGIAGNAAEAKGALGTRRATPARGPGGRPRPSTFNVEPGRTPESNMIRNPETGFTQEVYGSRGDATR